MIVIDDRWLLAANTARCTSARVASRAWGLVAHTRTSAWGDPLERLDREHWPASSVVTRLFSTRAAARSATVPRARAAHKGNSGKSLSWFALRSAPSEPPTNVHRPDRGVHTLTQAWFDRVAGFVREQSR